MKLLLLSLLLSCCITSIIGQSSPLKDHPDYQEVTSAIQDYVDALYLVDSTKIVRSVHPTLRKVGYWYNAEEDAYRDNAEMTYDQLKSLAASWNTSGENANAQSLQDIVIFDINDKSASAKLTAAWGIDLFHLSKIDNNWMIMNVLWQSSPK